MDQDYVPHWNCIIPTQTERKICIANEALRQPTSLDEYPNVNKLLKHHIANFDDQSKIYNAVLYLKAGSEKYMIYK